MRIVKLPCYGFVLIEDEQGVCAITNDLRNDDTYTIEYDAAVTGIESIILAAFSANVNIESREMIEAIETAVQKIFDQYPSDY